MEFEITFNFKFRLSVTILFHQNAQYLPGLSANEFLKIRIEFILHSVQFRNSQSSHFTKWQNIEIFFICTALNNKISKNHMKMCIITLIKSISNFIVWTFSSRKNNKKATSVFFSKFVEMKEKKMAAKKIDWIYACDVTYLSHFLILIG